MLLHSLHLMLSVSEDRRGLVSGGPVAEVILHFKLTHNPKISCKNYCFQDEQYWKNSYYTKFPAKKELGVSFWKGKYLSTCLQDYLENVKPDVFIEEDAAELAKLVLIILQYALVLLLV